MLAALCKSFTAWHLKTILSLFFFGKYVDELQPVSENTTKYARQCCKINVSGVLETSKERKTPKQQNKGQTNEERESPSTEEKWTTRGWKKTNVPAVHPSVTSEAYRALARSLEETQDTQRGLCQANTRLLRFQRSGSTDLLPTPPPRPVLLPV